VKHSHLVEHAKRYLKRVCVFHTTTGIAEERPDAIGWMASGQSVLMEAKTCRKDLLDEWSRRDRKLFRKQSRGGLGVLRTYITPPSILTAGEAEAWGWGLLEVHSGKFVRKAESQLWEPDFLLELRLLSGICSKVKFVPEKKQTQLIFPNEGHPSLARGVYATRPTVTGKGG
jgi:hypothetical protein